MWVITKFLNWFAKINFIKLSVYILVAVVITCAVMSETLAKYQSTYISVDYAAAAAWTFEVQDAEITKVNTFTVDVFNSSRIYDENGIAVENEAKNSRTINDATVPLIAPGTSGSFDLKLENLSDVPVLCTITVDESFASGINFNYKFAAGDSFSATNTKQFVMSHNEVTDPPLTIYWQWPFNDGETANDNLVKDGTTPCTVTVTVSAKQINQPKPLS